MSTIVSMLKTLPQINHRLEVKKLDNDVLLMDKLLLLKVTAIVIEPFG